MASERTEQREGGRRRRAAVALLVGEALCRDTAARLPGAAPGDARAALLDAAEQLSVLGERLRRLVRPAPAERRSEARRLASDGMPQREIASMLGVADCTLRRYLRDHSR